MKHVCVHGMRVHLHECYFVIIFLVATEKSSTVSAKGMVSFDFLYYFFLQFFPFSIFYCRKIWTVGESFTKFYL